MIKELKQCLEIYIIDNGYLVKFNNSKIKSYQIHATNNQISLMFTDIFQHLGEKNYRVVTDHDAAKMALSKRPHDRIT